MFKQRDLTNTSLQAARQRTAWLLLIPVIVVMLLVAGWPLLRTIAFSFTDSMLTRYADVYIADGQTSVFDLRYEVERKSHISVALDDVVINPDRYTLQDNSVLFFTAPANGTYVDIFYEPMFVGLSNYIYLLKDATWWRAVYNTVFFAVVSVALETMIGLGIALLLNANLPGKGLFRTAVLIPWAIPTIVSAKMWGWMYHDLFGVINAMLLGVGLISDPIAWTADPNLSLWAVIFVDVWKTTPFMTLLILAALQLVPHELYEAAKVDGIKPWQRFWHITLPFIKPALMVAIIFRLLDAMRVFDLIYVLSSNSRDTMSMSVYVRQQLIDFGEVGYGSAAATLLFMFIAFITAMFVTTAKVKVETN